MSGTASNIIIGAAVVKMNGTDVGYTKGGQSVKYKPDFISIVADQANGVVRKARSQETATLKFTLLEVTLEMLRMAMMQPVANINGGYTVLTVGYNDACYTDNVHIQFIGKGLNCGTRTFDFPKCIITDAERMYEMRRDQEVNFDMEFEVLKDNTGVLYTITDS